MKINKKSNRRSINSYYPKSVKVQKSYQLLVQISPTKANEDRQYLLTTFLKFLTKIKLPCFCLYTHVFFNLSFVSNKKIYVRKKKLLSKGAN